MVFTRHINSEASYLINESISASNLTRWDSVPPPPSGSKWTLFKFHKIVNDNWWTLCVVNKYFMSFRVKQWSRKSSQPFYSDLLCVLYKAEDQFLELEGRNVDFFQFFFKRPSLSLYFSNICHHWDSWPRLYQYLHNFFHFFIVFLAKTNGDAFSVTM